MEEWELCKEEITEAYEKSMETARYLTDLGMNYRMGGAIDAGKAEIAKAAQKKLARWVLRQRQDYSFSYQDSQFSKLLKWLKE